MVTMQNVACPTITVNRPSWIPSGDSTVRKALLSAMPVTMPGSAIGRMTSSDTVSRPKNRYRCTANAAIVPSTHATAVAPRPALTEVHSADRTPPFCQARDHHSPVTWVGGQANVLSALNELISTTNSGT